MALTCGNTQTLDLGLEQSTQHFGLLFDGSLPALCRSRAVFTLHGHASESMIVRNIAPPWRAGSLPALPCKAGCCDVGSQVHVRTPVTEWATTTVMLIQCRLT